MNSAALMGAGVGLTALGLIGTIVGISLAGNAERTEACYTNVCDDFDLDKRAGGLVLGFVGLGGLAAGIPMIAVGARQVPELAPGGPALAPPPMGAQLYVGPGVVRVTW